MIVQCEKCQSMFNVTEAILKKEGSKVRCSLCRHVFTVYPLVDVPSEEQDAVNQEALEGEEQLTDTGLDDVDIDFDEFFKEDLQKDISDDTGQEELEGFEEETAEEMEEIMAGDLFKEESVSLDLEDADELEDISDELETKELSTQDTPIDVQEGAAKSEDKEIDLGVVFEEPAENQEVPWKMEEESLEGFSDEAEGVDDKIPVGINRDVLPDSISVDGELGVGPGAVAESTIIPASEERPRPSRLPIVILVILLLFIGGAVALQFLDQKGMPEFLSFLKSSETKGKTNISIKGLTFNSDTVNGSYVTSKTAGTLYVIRGIVKNESEKRQSFIFVRGSILDQKGQVLRRKSVYAGNTLDEDKIKEVSMAEINKALSNRYGIGRKNVNVAKGESVPFMIVFDNLPQSMSEFTVELLSSSPGA